MEFVDHETLVARLGPAVLVEALRDTFAAGRIEAPPRQALTIPTESGPASLLIMPAWDAGRGIGVKVVTFFPGNAALGKPTINASFLLFDGTDGSVRAVLDGEALTAARTAAASALAADFLARRDARVLLVVGTGKLAVPVAQAHAAVRQYASVLIWGRRPSRADDVAAELVAAGLPARACSDLEAGCRAADVVSTVTASTSPLVRGGWLRPGTHLDLIGAFRADMRESDTEAVTGASIFVDERDGALLAGDLAVPLAAGDIAESDVQADLAELVRGEHPGRRDDAERTVFTSVGLAAEDLAAALLAVE
jgi:ornithine cyclodeaminase